MSLKQKEFYPQKLTSSVTYLIVFFFLVWLYYAYYSSSDKPYPTKFQNNDCGLILFLHINKCGGGSFVNWLGEHTTVLYQHQGSPRIESLGKLGHHRWESWNSRIPAANDFVNKIKPKTGWKAFHIHNSFPGLYYLQENLREWKATVENNGCIFHQTTMLRDPLDRFVSNVNFNIPIIDIELFMESRKNWLSRYLLFGLCGYHEKEVRCGYDRKGNFTITPNLNERYKEELKRIIGTFDSIGFTDSFGEHLETIKRLTGWKDKNPEKSETRKAHKSDDHFDPQSNLSTHFNLTGSLLKKFIQYNRDDYVLYYTTRNSMNKIL